MGVFLGGGGWGGESHTAKMRNSWWFRKGRRMGWVESGCHNARKELVV